MNTNYIRNITSKLMDNLQKRLLLLPAITSVLFMLMTYRIGLKLTSIILGVTIIITLCKKKSSTVILTALILVYLTTFCFVTRFGLEPIKLNNQSVYYYKVISVEDRLDGSSNIILNSKETGRVLYKSTIDSRPGIRSTIKVPKAPLTVDPPTNPGEFNYKEYLRKKNINYIYYEDTSFEYVTDSKTNHLESINSKVYAFKQIIINNFGDRSGLAAGIFLGDTSLIDTDTRQSFKDSNCSHLLAVSGTHFAGFLVLITFLLNYIKDNKVKSAIYIAFCLALCVLTGWTASVTRAALISICVYICRDKVSGLALGTFITAVLDPLLLISNSFLMSYSICISIFMFAPSISKYVKDRFGIKTSTICVLIAAQIGLMPFWVMLNPRFGILILMMQCIISFIAQIACTIFVPIMSISWISPIVVKPIVFVLDTIVKASEFSSRLPYLVKLGNAPVIAFVLITIIFKLPRRYRKRLLSFVLVVSISVRVITFVKEPLSQVIFIDVGQGDSILILSSYTILIDGGTYANGSKVESVLDYYGVEAPDATIVTHWDEDHCGGIRYLYEKGRLQNVYSSYFDNQIPDVIEICKGDKFNLGDSYLRCLSPGKNFISDDNDRSVVLEYVSDSCKILFTGDIPSGIEMDLIEGNYISDVDVLKAAHHGSKYSTCDELLDTARPEHVVFSVGERNRYGHPAPSVVKRILNRDINIYDTRYSGAVIINIYKNNYEIESYL